MTADAAGGAGSTPSPREERRPQRVDLFPFPAVLTRHGTDLVARMSELAAEELPADERLLRLAELQVSWFREHPHWARIATAFVSPGARADLPGGEMLQHHLEAGPDPQARANGYIGTVTDVDGIERELVLAPVRFDGPPPEIRRAPQHAEHTDEILRELGIDDDQLIALELEGAVT